MNRKQNILCLWVRWRRKLVCFVVGTVALVRTYIARVLVHVFAALDSFSLPFPSVHHVDIFWDQGVLRTGSCFGIESRLVCSSVLGSVRHPIHILSVCSFLNVVSDLLYVERLTVVAFVPGVLSSTSLKMASSASSLLFFGNLFGDSSFNAWQNCSKVIFCAPFVLKD